MKKFLSSLLRPLAALIRPVCRYGISLLCLIYAFKGVPLADLWAVMRNLPVAPMILAVALSFVAYAVIGVRLMFMLVPHLRFLPCYCASLVGLALNNVLPAKAGEIAMAAWISRVGVKRAHPCADADTRTSCPSHNVPFNTSLGMVFMGRFMDVNALGLLSLWFLWDWGQRRTAATMAACLVAGWAILLLLRRRPSLAALWGKLPLPAKITDFLTRFTMSLVEQMSPRRLAWTAASTAVLWSLYALGSWITLNMIAKLGLDMSGVIGVFALSSLGMLLPSSPGALGVYEAVMVTALCAYGAPRDQALAITLFSHMAQFIPVTLVGGLIFLAFPTRRMR